MCGYPSRQQSAEKILIGYESGQMLTGGKASTKEHSATHHLISLSRIRSHPALTSPSTSSSTLHLDLNHEPHRVLTWYVVLWCVVKFVLPKKVRHQRIFSSCCVSFCSFGVWITWITWITWIGSDQIRSAQQQRRNNSVNFYQHRACH
jgi:hypothetical protein